MMKEELTEVEKHMIAASVVARPEKQPTARYFFWVVIACTIGFLIGVYLFK